MMRKQVHWLSIFSLIFALVFVACAAPKGSLPVAQAAGQASTPSPAPAKPQLTAEQQLIEGAKKEGEVVFWTTTWDEGNIVKLFKVKYPFLTVKVWIGSQTVISKALEEAQAGRHSWDVLTVVENDLPMSQLKDLFQDYGWTNAKGWPYQPAHGYYANFRSSLKVPAYNTQLVSRSEAPKGWDDIKDPKWKGKSLASASANDLPLALAVLWGDGGKLNWEKSETFWRDVFRNTSPKNTSGYVGGVEMLGAGDVSIFNATALSTLLRLIWMGGPVDFVPIEIVAGAGSLAIAKDAPHPNAARLWADFLTSREGLVAYAEANGMIVFDPEAAKKARPNQYVASRGIKWSILSTQLMTPENVKRSNLFWGDLISGKIR